MWRLGGGRWFIPPILDCEDELAQASCMVHQYETGEQLAKLMADEFTIAGIEVASTYVIPEYELEEGAKDDEEFAGLGDI